MLSFFYQYSMITENINLPNNRYSGNNMNKYIIANWKMNGLRGWKNRIENVLESDIIKLKSENISPILCPPATLISYFASFINQSFIQLGAQDCHTESRGAYTGDLSAEMLKDSGANYVIIGHSERRSGHFETDEMISKKIRSALSFGLTPILCVGEEWQHKEQGNSVQKVIGQLDQDLVHIQGENQDLERKLIIAYEPVWAIGSGKIPKNNEIQNMHLAIRKNLINLFGKQSGKSIPILYGGSVNSENAKEIFGIPEVEGGLIGGASLQMESFLSIVKALQDESIIKSIT